MTAVRCLDVYEAQKLAGMILGSEEMAAPIRGILNVFGSEVVVKLVDGSAHSILLAGGSEAEAFTDFMQSVLEGRHRVTVARVSGSSVLVAKSPVSDQ